ncbi:MAG: hypothetical protein M1820_007908 [Bogoriella megaspora]|nr:MAG: hypothetical protein M1820_007908 [Bogoriella megaspora]
MASHSYFLALPLEIRTSIYQYYVLEEDGYHYHYQPGKTGKLSTSNYRPINLALMYTCRSVAAEMRGVALGTNIVIFKTMDLGIETEQMDPAALNYLTHVLSRWKEYVVFTAIRVGRFSPDLISKIACKFPQYEAVLEKFSTGRIDYTSETNFSWGQAGSVHRSFVDYTVECLSKLSDFRRLLGSDATYRGPETYPENDMPDSLMFWNEKPWSLFPASKANTGIVSEAMDHFEDSSSEHFERFFEYRFSAAAAAITCLQSMSLGTRLQIRNISLREDRQAVAYPESHALGLIPFCVENERLRIERQVSLWRNAFPAGACMIGQIMQYDYWIGRGSPFLDFEGRDKLLASDVSSSFNVWIKEALALCPAGMPRNSFSLVFDGDPSPDQSSEVFERVKRDAAWQVAQDQWYAERGITPSFLEERNTNNYCYHFESFPKAIKDIVEGKSFIRCNFPVGVLWNAMEVLNENRECSLEEWSSRWKSEYEPQCIETRPPLPVWLDLRYEQVAESRRKPAGT